MPLDGPKSSPAFIRTSPRCYLENTRPRLKDQELNQGIMDKIDEVVDRDRMVVDFLDLRPIPGTVPFRPQSYPPSGPPTKATPTNRPDPPPPKQHVVKPSQSGVGKIGC